MLSSQTWRILAVDDLPDNLFLLQTILEAEGFDVELALSGSLALAKIEASPPDLVLLDVRMPEMDGYEVTQRLRQNRKFSEIPIVLITADVEASETRGLAVGANDFIRKPIDFDELLARIRVFCS